MTFTSAIKRKTTTNGIDSLNKEIAKQRHQQTGIHCMHATGSLFLYLQLNELSAAINNHQFNVVFTRLR